MNHRKPIAYSFLSLAVVSLAVLTLAALPALAAAAAPALLQPAAADLAPGALVAPAVPGPTPQVPREPVAVSWALDPERPLDPHPPRITGTSKGYWLDVSAADLRRGVRLDTVSPGAVVRINPAPEGPSGRLAAAGAGLDPRSLVVSREGARLAGGEAMELLADADEMAAAGVAFPAGTSAFRLRGDLGSGAFLLQAPELAAGAGRYVVHVHEPASEVVLELAASRPDYLHGQTLEVSLQLAGASGLKAARPRVDSIDAFVLSPAGRLFPLRFAPATPGSGYRARLVLDAQERLAEGLWEVQAVVTGRSSDLTLRRGGRTAFQVALPTARLSGVAAASTAKSGLGVRFAVETAAAGRYEVRGVLYGRDAGGTARPFAIAHSADWLEAGDGEITLSFDAKLVAESGLSAPYEIRDLRLYDQGRMGLLHRQQRGLVLE